MRTENIAQRLRRLIAAAVDAGRYKSLGEFLEKNGLSNGAIQELETRLAKDPKASMLPSTARKYATGLSIPIAYILNGDAQEDDIVFDKYPERAQAMRAARGLMIAERAIQAVLREDPGGRPSVMWWFRRIETEEQNAAPTADSGSHKI